MAQNGQDRDRIEYGGVAYLFYRYVLAKITAYFLIKVLKEIRDALLRFLINVSILSVVKLFEADYVLVIFDCAA